MKIRLPEESNVGKVRVKLRIRTKASLHVFRNCALHVIKLYGPGDKVSPFLKDWELARVALSYHIALDMMCQEMHEVVVGLTLPEELLCLRRKTEREQQAIELSRFV